MNRTLVAIGLLIGLAAPALATRGVENSPKVLTYSSAMSELPPAVRDTLSWYDVIVCMDRPTTLQGLRQRNPNQRYLWQVQPQYSEPYAEQLPWWLPDTTWSAKRLFMLYVKQNNWYLRDINGQIITDGVHQFVNWTRYCPVGTYGSAKGLRASQWMASVGLPAITLSGRGMPPWSWDSYDSYNGLMFEILADCLGSYGWGALQYADPNQDGIAEGVTHTCTGGGTNDPLSVLYREENEEFYQRLSAVFPDDFVFTINENTSPVGPWWRTRLSGMKLENWMRGLGADWLDWWDYFYGITPPDYPDQNWGSGYYWAEQMYDKPVEDRLKGWDLSFIVTWNEQNKSGVENLRKMRLGLGTAMLGDGYFDYSLDDRHPQWQPEFDWDFGNPMGNFTRELYGADTLYVRTFTKGMVSVNPNATSVDGVTAGDSRFTFWLPVEDLQGESAGLDAIRARWITPQGEHNNADSFELRYATSPITLENWANATPYAGNPIIAAPGSPVDVQIDGLASGQTYSLAIRTRTQGRPEPLLSNIAQARTDGVPDTTPPGMIVDLHATDIGQDWVQLAWTSVGDDGNIGIATSTRIRFLIDDTIDNESDWNRAIVVNGVGAPRPPGVTDTFRIRGLAAGRSYGIAVRARDDVGLLSPLHPAVEVRTIDAPPPPPADREPPATITDLAGEAGDPGQIRIHWSAPGDDGWEGLADHYMVRTLRNRIIANESDWTTATPYTRDLPEPGAPRSLQSVDLTGLTPGVSYGISVRAVDDGGNVGGISNSLLSPAGTEAPPPVDDIPPSAIADLRAESVTETGAILAWTATGDDGNEGTALVYEFGFLKGRAIAVEADWIAADPKDVALPRPARAGTRQTYSLTGLDPGTIYGVAMRARDEADNLSPLGPATTIETATPPPPPPPDPEPPAAIADLRLVAAGIDTAQVEWTAPGDDGDVGQAKRYLMRIRVGGAIATEEDWLAATEVDTSGVGRPAPAGSSERWILRDLTAETIYGLAIRAVDDSALVGGISNPLEWTTESLPPDPTQPETIVDMTSTGRGHDWVDLAWTAPAVQPTGTAASRYRIAYHSGTEPIGSEEAWLASLKPDAALPVPAYPGTQEHWTLEGLTPATPYAVTLRAEDADGHMSDLGPTVHVETTAAPDTTVDPPPPPPRDPPPAPILDLAAIDRGTTWVDLTWTAVGRDSLDGRAARYDARVVQGRAIVDESDWNTSPSVETAMPTPGEPGTIERVRIAGLAPGVSYGFVVRAVDDVGQPSALTGGVLVTTLTPPPEPPAPIQNLAVEEITTGGARVRWSHSSDSGDPAGPARFVLGISRDPIDEATWPQARKHPNPPLPGAAGAVVAAIWDGLEESTPYWTAVRVQSADSLWSTLAVAAFTTSTTPDLAPPAPPSGLRIAGMDEFGQTRLEWDPSSDADLAGYRVYGRSDGGSWHLLLTEMLPASATSVVLESPPGAEFALAAVDLSGNESSYSPPVLLEDRVLGLRGPFPHPVTDRCRFEVDLQLGVPSSGVVLRILDSTGKEIRRVESGTPVGVGVIEILWDRKDGAGRPAAPGFYLVVLEAGGRTLHRRIFAAP